MAEGGFDPDDPNSFEMNEDKVYQDDDIREDLPLIDVSQNIPSFSHLKGVNRKLVVLRLYNPC